MRCVCEGRGLGWGPPHFDTPREPLPFSGLSFHIYKMGEVFMSPRDLPNMPSPGWGPEGSGGLGWGAFSRLLPGASGRVQS